MTPSQALPLTYGSGFDFFSLLAPSTANEGSAAVLGLDDYASLQRIQRFECFDVSVVPDDWNAMSLAMLQADIAATDFAAPARYPYDVSGIDNPHMLRLLAIWDCWTPESGAT